MAFDFGTKKIGVAVGQTVTLSASPLPELKAKEGQPQWDQIVRLIDEWQPDGFVVGIPVLMNGEPFEITHRAQKFAQRLHGRFGLPWFPMDERLSSFEARELAASHNQREGLVDSLAACLILESWFNEHWPRLQKEATQ